jgi:endonuclease/exonuclease/phosphatase family metal-dependent hydrolase
VFAWKLRTVRPLKPVVDETVRLLHAAGSGTMRFHHTPSGETVFVTSVHLSSKKAVAREQATTLFLEYDDRMSGRYEKADRGLHLVMGDFNFNPHAEGWVEELPWLALGDIRTQTSSGGRGYDFVFVNRSFLPRISASSQVIVQRSPKNSAASRSGVSDHDPVIARISFFREAGFTNDGEGDNGRE